MNCLLLLIDFDYISDGISQCFRDQDSILYYKNSMILYFIPKFLEFIS